MTPNGSFLRISRGIYINEGLSGFWTGVIAIMGRAFFANGFGFLAWEYSKNYFGSKNR